MQEDIINSVLQGKDTLALLPTGGGKSVCFQVPTLVKPGLCLVVSPLIALMKDQVENLRKKNITAFSIHSGMNRREVINTLSLAGHSNCKFLYVSPERLETNLFKEYLPSLGVSLIAVDEAHCISQWGYDFRPSYLRIAALREELPGIPILALTASATEEVQKDICLKLLFTNSQVFRQSFERANLSYSAFKVESPINKILEILNHVPGTAIVYCKTRRRAKEIGGLLNMHGIPADHYHAGLLQEERNQKQEAWLKNTIRVITCTNAFGMGIDKPDVRVVIHADTPDCLENYYQEAGRAGRDGLKSYAVLLYNDKELDDLKLLPDIRFPSLATIRKIYEALMNHLQIASGTGEGASYEMDLSAFIKQFSLDTFEVVASLKTLEQEELLYFNEQVFVLSKVAFTCGKKELYDFEKEHPALEPVIKTLLRNYEGIIDQPVTILEKTIAGILKMSLPVVKDALKQLHAFGVIQYTPQKEKPQLFLSQNRVRAQDLHIDMDMYRRRRKQFSARVDALVNYVVADDVCRSVIIGKYFGDADIRACGICDTCLQLKKSAFSKEEFEAIHENILKAIIPSGAPIKKIMEGLGASKKEKTWKALEFLQSENKIMINEKGWITKR